MAKKKDVIEADDFLSIVESQINAKNIGFEYVNAVDLVENPPPNIPITPNLDMATGGGIMAGSIVAISGKEKHGKTSLALKICANAQREENGKRHIYWHDMESRLEKRGLEGTFGLDYTPKNFSLARSRKGGILVGEQHLSAIEAEINSHPGCIVVVDSLSALYTKSDQTSEISGNKRPSAPKLISDFLKHISGPVRVNESVLILMLHIYQSQDPNAHGAFLEDCGKKVQYYINYKLRTVAKKEWTEGDNQVGMKFTWVMANSPLSGCMNNAKVESWMRFGYGMDEIAEYVELGKTLGLVGSSGAWLKYNEKSYCGINAMCELFQNSPDEYSTFVKEIRTRLFGVAA